MTPATADKIRIAFLAAAEEVVAALSDEPAAGAPDKLLTVEQVADHLAISRTLAYRLVGRGHIRSLAIGRARRVPASAVSEYIAAQEARR